MKRQKLHHHIIHHSTYFDLLPLDVINYIWRFVNQENLNRIIQFNSYRFYMKIKRKYDHPQKQDIIVQNGTKTIIPYSKTSYFIQSLFRHVNAGDTCGIFNPNIIYNSEQLFFLVFLELQ